MRKKINVGYYHAMLKNNPVCYTIRRTTTGPSLLAIRQDGIIEIQYDTFFNTSLPPQEKPDLMQLIDACYKELNNK